MCVCVCVARRFCLKGCIGGGGVVCDWVAGFVSLELELELIRRRGYGAQWGF